MRTDLRNSNGNKIRTGKLIAQGCHASLKAVLDSGYVGNLPKKSAIKDWFDNGVTKICVSVDSEKELLEIYNRAKSAGLLCALIIDAGLTEFDGVPTKTCCAIGPDWSDEIDKITGNLKLL